MTALVCCIYISLDISLYPYMSLSIVVHLGYIYLSVYPSCFIFLSSVDLDLNITPFLYLFIYMSTCSSFYLLSICLPARPSIYYLSVYLLVPRPHCRPLSPRSNRPTISRAAPRCPVHTINQSIDLSINVSI